MVWSDFLSLSPCIDCSVSGIGQHLPCQHRAPQVLCTCRLDYQLVHRWKEELLTGKTESGLMHKYVLAGSVVTEERCGHL